MLKPNVQNSESQAKEQLMEPSDDQKKDIVIEPNSRQRADKKIIQIQNHRLWRYICETKEYNKKKIAKESGISEQSFFHWCNPEGMGEPREDSLKKMQKWLRVPWEDLMEYLNDKDYHPRKIWAKVGTAEVIKADEDVDWRDWIDDLDKLSSQELFKLNQYIHELLGERLFGNHNKDQTEIKPEENTRELDDKENSSQIIEPKMRERKERQGQDSFREIMIEIYKGQCIITGCEILEILEAAHILPYSETNNHAEENGLLLRVDIHRLFDSNLLGIDPENLRVHLHNKIRETEYSYWHGQKILPIAQKMLNKKILKKKWEDFQNG